MSQANSPIVTARLSAYNMVDPTQVLIDPTWNIRFDKGDIEELAAEIKARKQIEPESGGLIVALILDRAEGGKLKVVDGERRMTAINLLMSEGETFPNGVPAKILPKGMSRRDKLVTMYQAGENKKFLPLEEAEFFRRMKVEEGMTIEQICEITGKRHVHVVATLALIDAAPELKEAVQKGEVGGTRAKKIAVAARGDKKKQAELAEKAKKAGKDKKKNQEVDREIEQVRAEKAAKQGKTIKMKAANEERLREMGEKAAKHFASVMKEASIPETGKERVEIPQDEAGLLEFIKADDFLALAYSFGVLQGLKAAAGLKVELEV